ncbi:MAG: extracellular solute-binding protein [Angelakisella sp.]
MKKITSILLALMMVLGMALGGCSNKSAASPSAISGSDGADSAAAKVTTEPGTFPISAEPITIRIMVPVQVGHSKPFKDLKVLQDYEKMTNVHIEWEEVPQEAYAEKYKLALASNNLPDAFGPSFNYDTSVIYKYAKEGIIIPLEDIIEKVGVNTKKYLNEREDFRKLTTFPDGHIYALPTVDENQNIRMGNFLTMNHTYLKKLGLEMPKTLDEVGDYLRKATTTDLNGDGKNEYGLSFPSNPGGTSRITQLFGMFGVSWEQQQYLHYTGGNSPFEFAPTMDGTRKAVEYFHGWYKEGLIDPEIFTQNGQQLKSKAKEAGVALSITSNYPELNSGDQSLNEYHLMDAIPGPNGDNIKSRDGLIPGYQPGQFFITSANKYPEETIRFIDYWMDNGENALTMRFGPKDVCWSWITPDKWTTNPKLPNGETNTQETATLHCTYGFGIPYWCFNDFWSQKEITIENALERGATIRDSHIKVATPGLPQIVYEEADNREASTIKTDLFKYVESQIAQFIINGVTDQSWDSYVSKCKSLKSERWVELYSQYYNKMYQ